MKESGSTLPVFLIHRDAPEWCGSAARSVLATEGVDVRLTVIDNGQTHGPNLGDCLPEGTRVIRMDTNRGYAGAANVALADAESRYPSGSYCVIGSHDLHVEPDTLGRLVQVADANPPFGIVAPVLTGPRPTAGGIWNGRMSMQVPIPTGMELVERDWASGTCLLLRRSCVEQVGAFDERLGSYMEDVDYGIRARDLGWQVVVVTAAEARGLGTASDHAITFITANTLLLHAKRSSARSLAAYLGLMLFWIGRGYLASVLPWRTHERKAVSRWYASQRMSAIVGLARSRALVDVLRQRRRVGAAASVTVS